MQKTDDLNKLFVKWRDHQKSMGPEYANRYFIPDGIIDEETFETESCRVLFISNEANTKYESHESCTADRRKDFLEFSQSGHDNWRGKMRIRMCELYKVIAQKPEMPANDAALHFAMMNVNKSGGGSSTDINALREYCRHFAEELLEEIRIIDPDIIIWCGHRTFCLASEYLGAEGEQGGKYFLPIASKKVPLIPAWHTSYFQGRIPPAAGYKDRTLGKQVIKLVRELEKHNWNGIKASDFEAT